MGNYFIGLISGTSVDGIDAVLVDLDTRSLSVIATHAEEYPPELAARLRRAMLDPASCGVDELGELHVWVGRCFRDAALKLLENSGLAANTIRAIGSHGQTLRHCPDHKYRFSLQIGDGATIATGTGIDTVADFRSSDIALGGEGAPLVPLFHDWLLRDADENRVVLNIGGIANITVLPASGAELSGFDTGPGNTLLDAWIRAGRELPYDDKGAWAASGEPDTGLIEEWLQDEWFARPPPKSTGVEYFNLDWLASRDTRARRPADVQASLAELTAQSVAHAIERWAPGTTSMYVCGGGVRNKDLLRRIAGHLPTLRVRTTADAGIDPDWVEAAAFAWLASRRLARQNGSVPSVTGAQRPAVLGAVYAR
ncbi:MAG TPA: anhydro-N-acetylmuramic acid kinase [Woeseiaceae bacterium]|nr:anhydro-N-acetylmuramic acid kinase [Woeseiaceae bacterium]